MGQERGGGGKLEAARGKRGKAVGQRVCARQPSRPGGGRDQPGCAGRAYRGLLHHEGAGGGGHHGGPGGVGPYALVVFREEWRNCGREGLHRSFLGCKKLHSAYHKRFVLEIQRDRIFAHITTNTYPMSQASGLRPGWSEAKRISFLLAIPNTQKP